MHGARPYTFEFVPAPAELAPYLNSFYVLRVGAARVEETLPAYSGQLMVVGAGSGRMDFGEGLVEAPGLAFFMGPLTAARSFVIDGPALVVGASFTFHGWAALTHLPTEQNSDRFLAVRQGAGERAATEILSLARRLQSGGAGPEDALAELSGILRDAIRPLPRGHAEVIEATYRWLNSSLNPDHADLMAALPLQKRQVQRLVKRFFGFAPSRLRRRFRAVRAATLLADPALEDARRMQVLQSFYDQAHMIREIREFTGRTPRLLAHNHGTFVGDTLGRDGYGVAELFAGDEAEQLARLPR